MDSIIETREINGFTVNVFYSDSAGNPREYHENLGTFFGFHRNYISPDTPPNSDPKTARVMAERGDNICLPVWLYDHSGTIYRAAVSNPFNCQWDSGLFGFIYCTRLEARKALGKKRLNIGDVETVKRWLIQEVKTYSDWANGQVFGFEVLDTDGEQVDSCYGFIGEFDYAMAQGIESANQLSQQVA